MAQVVNATNLQKTEFDVTTSPDGPSHVTIVTGRVNFFLAAQSQGPQVIQKESIETLLDPQLAPGQFRKAVAMVSIATANHFAQDPAAITTAQWSIDQAEATLDDESGRVQLRIDASVIAAGNNTIVQIQAFAFQVTTLSKL